MARMHSRKRGKSSSNKPVKKIIPSWLGYKSKEAELLVVKLAKDGDSPSQIGLHLRDRYGIPDVKTLTKKSITGIMKEKNLLHEIPEDLMAVIRRNVQLRKHLENNRQDKVANRGLQLAESKIKRLIKYYKNSGKLSAEWKYNPEKIRLLIE